MGSLWTAGQRETASLLNQYYGYSDTTATTVTAAAQTQLTTTYSIPANEPAVGSSYELNFGGSGTWGSTQQLLAFSLSVGGVVLLNNIAGIAATAFAASAGFRFSGFAIINWSAIGSSGGIFGELTVTVTQAANAVNPGTASTNTISIADANASVSTINSTAAVPVFARCGWANVTGAPTITNRHTTFRKIA